MVYALEEIHRLLKPAGALIEIHPSMEGPPLVEVRSNGRLSFAEDDPGFDYAEDVRQAEAAVASVVDQGMFVLEDRRRFELRTYADSVKELRDYWEVAGAYDPEEKEETLVRRRDEMYERAHAGMEDAARPSEIVYVEPATMSRLTASR
ncbi:MAG TPA: hypothetical protein VFU96_10430 [Acidimicrobiia bacterium]|nr:hypothetical protein [Acidimicrobiia bacterium]